MKEVKQKILNRDIGEIEFCEYENGILNGLREIKCGHKPSVKAFYCDGKLHGIYESWYDNGQQHVKCYFEKGQYHGEYVSWWKNGNVKEKGEYKQGKKVSTYEWYNQDGHLINSYK